MFVFVLQGMPMLLFCFVSVLSEMIIVLGEYVRRKTEENTPACFRAVGEITTNREVGKMV